MLAANLACPLFNKGETVREAHILIKNTKQKLYIPQETVDEEHACSTIVNRADKKQNENIQLDLPYLCGSLLMSSLAIQRGELRLSENRLFIITDFYFKRHVLSPI